MRNSDQDLLEEAYKSIHLIKEGAEKIYHVTYTENVDNIKAKGMLPDQDTNWVQAGDKSEYGRGYVYAMTNPVDAIKWAAKMDWAKRGEWGSGDISILEFKNDGEWEIDDNDPASQSVNSGQWLKRKEPLSGSNLINSFILTRDIIKNLKF